MPLKPHSRRLDRTEAAEPTTRDILLAREAAVRLMPYGKDGLPVRISGEHGLEFELPAPAVRLLTELLGHLAAGSAVTLVPTQSELTTRQAADLLGVSRPFLSKELDKGKMPFRMVGTHRRIKLVDLIAYRDAMDGRRHAALAELTTQAQGLRIGY